MYGIAGRNRTTVCARELRKARRIRSIELPTGTLNSLVLRVSSINSRPGGLETYAVSLSLATGRFHSASHLGRLSFCPTMTGRVADNHG